MTPEQDGRKATFRRKYYGRGYERSRVYMDYEYRGHEYTVEENRAVGNAPLSWQHRSEQARIDQLIEEENRPRKPYRYEDSAQAGLDLLWRLLDGEEPDDGNDGTPQAGKQERKAS